MRREREGNSTTVWQNAHRTCVQVSILPKTRDFRDFVFWSGHPIYVYARIEFQEIALCSSNVAVFSNVGRNSKIIPNRLTLLVTMLRYTHVELVLDATRLVVRRDEW